KTLALTDFSLTLGNWGRAPLSINQQRQVLRTLANWAEKTGVVARAELYARPAPQQSLIEEWISEKTSLELTIREDPRSDRLKQLAKIGATSVVIEVPTSVQTAIRRFRPKGIDIAAPYAERAARDTVLAGLTPEIALVDVARAKKSDVLLIVDKVLEAIRPHDGIVRWRLVDSTGWADPIAGSRLPRSLPAWIRGLHSKFGIACESITVQCADTLGFANANTVAGAAAGASTATSLFGLGMSCGWGATEVILAHMLDKDANTKRLMGLRNVLISEDMVPLRACEQGSATGSAPRDSHRPVSGPNAWQFPGGAAPEKPSDELLDAHFPIPPKTLSRHDPEPLLTALSGHAGLLHLMHRQWPEQHFQSEDGRPLEISNAFQAEFAEGRQIPVSWTELMPKVIASGVVDSGSVDS
ncbi:MAG TPA: hypothetical protein ENH10_09610, partial [Bacteroidetes bacterium]|nr:hypothetical protein [Bacteroidota bacterium]HEX05389.1 hypothetical protein [Bacteroidota bacterium]